MDQCFNRITLPEKKTFRLFKPPTPLSVTAIEAALSGQIKINMGCWLPADTLQ